LRWSLIDILRCAMLLNEGFAFPADPSSRWGTTANNEFERPQVSEKI
jgi:hypothetical protein